MATTQSMTNERLDRIEAKIDKLTEALNGVLNDQGRTEQRLMQGDETMKLLMNKILKVEERMDKNERIVDESAVTVSAINRVFWVAITGTIVTFIGAYLFRKS